MKQHPLIGQMNRLSPWQIGQLLERHPPDRYDAHLIATEELRRKNYRGQPDDRSAVYRLLAKYVPPMKENAA